MKLYFQGVTSYEDNSPMLEVTEREIVDRNRSQYDSSPYVRHIPMPPPTPSLRERNLSYSINKQNHFAELALSTQPEASKSERRQFDKNPEINLEETDKAQQAQICRRPEQRLSVTETAGAKNLIHLLKDESKKLTFCKSI